MNCNEEFVVKALGKLTLEFNFDWKEQKKISEILHLSLYGFDVLSQEKGLMTSDLKEKISLYIQVKKLENYSESTLKNYLYTLRTFESTIKKPVIAINKNDIRYFLATTCTNNKASTVNSKIFCLKGFFQWLTDEEIISNNPARLIKDTKVPKRLREPLTIEEIEKLRIACQTNRERSLLEFLFSTGCRVSELCEVKISDLNVYEKSLNIIGKGDKERKVYFSPKCKIYIEKYLNERKDNNPYLFVSQKYPFNKLRKRGVEVIISKIGLRTDICKPIFPHILRHSMATIGLSSGADLTTIQHLLGHTSPSITQTYAKVNYDNIKHSYNQHFIS